MNKTKPKLIILIILTLCASFLIWVSFRNTRDTLTVTFLDIGQGDAIFIEAPSGNQMLIDGGQGKAVLRELSKVMPFYDRSLDIILATHPDSDHIGGLNDVLEKYKINLFIESGVESDTNIYNELKKLVNAKNIKTIEARRGMMIDLGGGTRFEILFPVLDPRGMETNTASIVGRLVYGQNEFLLTGDSPSSIENYLVSIQSETLESDVLKAGHHGSKTSTNEAFVQAVSPEYVVISAGKNNRYGHPHQEVLNILSKSNIKILRTDQSGRIMFKSDGINLKIK